MSEAQSPPARPPETPGRRTRRAWWIFAASFCLLGLIAVTRLVTEGVRPIDLVVVGLVLAVGFAAVRHHRAVALLEVAGREEAASFARILSSLSRSVSPDAILGAIVAELASATAADHIAIVRRRPNARVLEATLVSARQGVPDSATILPIGDLEDPVTAGAGSSAHEPAAIPTVVGGSPPAEVGGLRTRFDDLAARIGAASPLTGPADATPATGRSIGERRFVADRIAARAARVYGLANTLAAPLSSEGDVIGAIVLSRRTAGEWSATTRQILDRAVLEASAALAWAYSLRTAEEQAATDALTGLPNRRYFDEFCGLLARRRRSDDVVGVLMVDVDRFKVLNDTHGHATGDEVLRAIGGAIVSAVREDDVPARYGGEEFVVLLRNPTPEVALDVGERVRASVAALDLGRFGVSGVSVSVGVAVASEADQAIDDLIVLADRALYRAKRAGRDRVVAA